MPTGGPCRAAVLVAHAVARPIVSISAVRTGHEQLISEGIRGVCTVFTQWTLSTSLGAPQPEIASIPFLLATEAFVGCAQPIHGGREERVAGVGDAFDGVVTRRRPKMSRQARKRIAEAQRKRWAE